MSQLKQSVMPAVTSKYSHSMPKFHGNIVQINVNKSYITICITFE